MTDFDIQSKKGFLFRAIKTSGFLKYSMFCISNQNYHTSGHGSFGLFLNQEKNLTVKRFDHKNETKIIKDYCKKINYICIKLHLLNYYITECTKSLIYCLVKVLMSLTNFQSCRTNKQEETVHLFFKKKLFLGRLLSMSSSEARASRIFFFFGLCTFMNCGVA